MLKRPRLPTRREPKQSRARETREHIQVAAMRALREKGAEVTMTHIADVAGYSIGTLYQYYPDRRALLCDLMVRVTDEDAAAVMAELPRFHSLPLREGIEGILRVLVRSASENRALQRAVQTDVLSNMPADAFEDLVPQFARLLAAQLERRSSDTRECDLEMASFFVLHGVEGVLLSTATDRPDWLDAPRFLDELVQWVYSYLRR